eukprot:gnl/TRDRNA2_/TRDRNA2_90114_c2_seq1.p1 gnl/TRDRNA2_/TRDRNA2_90114_c2~~gnl/TRDRNA2_/TRDRNA2_90114_c2_seq1.p1  ORF type:complete len:521 (+),score=82.44 gnl/TRDRNA2_/TRDRNA2_90114_c2_seq1:198-1565(+)
MDRHLIWSRYLWTWFPLDVVIVGSDWLFTIMSIVAGSGGDGGQDNVAKLLRTFRVVRILRLLRVAKLKKVLTMVKDKIQSEYVFLIVSICQLMLLVVFVNHLIGSTWYLVGDIGKGTDSNNWIEESLLDDDDLFYRYATAVHWSLTQFAPGAAMDVQPQNSVERLYAILVLIMGMMMFSSFTASITNSMMQLRNMGSENSRQFWLLRRYLRQQGVPNSLTFRVLRYLEYACSSQEEEIPESRLTVLQLLSEQLQEELRYQVSFAAILKHPLFNVMHLVSDVASRGLAGAAFSRKSLSSGDVLFTPKTTATHMYFVVTGELSYKCYSQPGESKVTLKAHDWLVEAALWVAWRHRGQARALTDCQIIWVDVNIFADVICKNDAWAPMVVDYARAYIAYLNELEIEDLSDVTGTSHEDFARTERFLHGLEAIHPEASKYFAAKEPENAPRFTMRRMVS